ncbi:MAG: hypothetical protein Q4C65_10460 [Eubacteriales bacterium]|nr:hypothetical protein [Eubacteriales bacterium]
MIIRREYRGFLKCPKETEPAEAFEEAAAQAFLQAKERAGQAVREGRLLTASLYRHENMCFFYEEALGEENSLLPCLECLTPFLESWPTEAGPAPWAYMYPIFYHQRPEDPESWMAGRQGEKNRVGRIAFLYPDKVFSYTYWHKALVDEGLLLGDRYQFISLHENILFSYFEEPRSAVNLSGSKAPSRAIEGWMAADPESHFDREKAGGDNFLVIDQVWTVGGERER